VAGEQNNETPCGNLASSDLVNADYSTPDSARDIGRDPQVTTIPGYRSIVSQITISRTREIREPLESGGEIEILRYLFSIEPLADALNFFKFLRGNIELPNNVFPFAAEITNNSTLGQDTFN
jgi:hypothetical protein